MAELLAGGKMKLGSYEIDLLDKIGQGSFGIVYKGIDHVNGSTVAAKQCDIHNDKIGCNAMEEIKRFQSVQNNPHIVKLHDFHYKNNAIWMTMEFCDAGDLERYVMENVPEIPDQINLMYQSASAISYMHCQVNTIIHRDVKPGNILLKRYQDTVIVKLTDFGLSKIVEGDGACSERSIMATSKAGTSGFMAPECFLNSSYDKSVDVFGLGLVFLAMLSFKPGDEYLAPKSGSLLIPIGAQMANLSQMKLPIPDFVKDDENDSQQVKSAKRLIRRMLRFRPKERCHMRQVVAALEDMGGKSPRNVPTTIPSLGRSTAQNIEKEMSDDGKKSTMSQVCQPDKDKFSTTRSNAEGPQHKTTCHKSGAVKSKATPPVKSLGTGKSMQKSGSANWDTIVRVPEQKTLSKPLKEAKREEPNSDQSEKQNTNKRPVKEYLSDCDESELDVDSGILAEGRPSPINNIENPMDPPISGVSVRDMGCGVINLEVPSGLPVPGESDDENDEKFKPVRRAIEQQIKEQHKLDNDGIKGMRALPFKELIRHCLPHDEALDQFEIGDQVIVNSDRDTVKRLQEGHGGYNYEMAKYLGKYGIVKGKQYGRMLKILHDDGNELVYNPKAVKKTGEKPFTSDQLQHLEDASGVQAIRSKFKRFDIVRLSEEEEIVQLLQEERGGWNDRIKHALGVKGMVNRVDMDGDVFVEFINGDDWTLNPETLIPCEVAQLPIDLGDFVIVVPDEALARKRQKELGLWRDGLKELLGHSGIVKGISKQRVTLEMGEDTVKWHPDLIKLVAKKDEFVQALMRKL